jgi:hypothetical protein
MLYLSTINNLLMMLVVLAVLRQATASMDYITTVAGTGTGSFIQWWWRKCYISCCFFSIWSGGRHLRYDCVYINWITSLIRSCDGFVVGNIFIADSRNHRVRKITISNGIITTIAGTGTGTGSYSGDGLSATSAGLNNPRGVVVDTSGTIITIIYWLTHSTYC